MNDGGVDLERIKDEKLFEIAQEIFNKLGRLTPLDWKNETSIKLSLLKDRFDHISLPSRTPRNTSRLYLIMPSEYQEHNDIAAFRKLDDTLRGDYWGNFSVMAGIPPYDYTRDQVIKKAVELVRAEGATKITPELWNRSLAPVVKYFDSWELFEWTVSSSMEKKDKEDGDKEDETLERKTPEHEAIKDETKKDEIEEDEALEDLMADIAKLILTFKDRFGLKLSFSITADE